LLYNGFDVAYVSKPDVAFLYREIVEKCCYLQHGIFLPKGGTVIDVGANIGIFTAQAAREVSKGGRVIACEPLPATFAALECNMQNLLTPGTHIPSSLRCQD
jgi:predicted O-methyltransferase YrrM